jgi:hypothetical protein
MRQQFIFILIPINIEDNQEVVAFCVKKLKFLYEQGLDFAELSCLED